MAHSSVMFLSDSWLKGFFPLFGSPCFLDSRQRQAFELQRVPLLTFEIAISSGEDSMHRSGQEVLGVHQKQMGYDYAIVRKYLSEA